MFLVFQTPGPTIDHHIMLGIDLTKISRFSDMDLIQLSRHLGQDCPDVMTAAKIWACREAIIKAENKVYPVTKVNFIFEKNCSPVVIDKDRVLKGSYVMSLSHEDDYVIVVAQRIKNW